MYRIAALSLFVIAFVAAGFGNSTDLDLKRRERQARNITITRDDWGIAHVVGRTDADAVFGMIYAQAEDDFHRVETNYMTSLGRTAEAEGEALIWQDLRQRLFIDAEQLKKEYAASPLWLRKLMDAWADGLNYYLAKHPDVKPRVITRFEPWMALSFTEGSIGGDIETINLNRLRQFYDTPGNQALADLTVPGPSAAGGPDDEPRGSNGIAIAPKNTKNKRALLLINPHTSFFFRSELQMTSREGLNAYGAATWGQFFIYQGFNERVGWMHTSSAVDAIDHYTETVSKKDGRWVYRHGFEDRPVSTRMTTLRYKTDKGMSERTFTTYHTHHGPIIRKTDDGRWESISLMHKPIEALMQSYGRTKARNLAEYKKVMELKANSSNNTLYADADGNIAYFHVNYVPRRDTKFDWRRPVDGGAKVADYQGIHDYAELPHLVNPDSGWVYNTNNWPWSAAGPSSSLKQSSYPAYVDNGTENVRGIHAMRLLAGKRDFTLESLNEAAYDSQLPWFEQTIPALVKAWDNLSASNPLKAKLKNQIEALRAWDTRWGVDSVATSLAIFWATDLLPKAGSTPGMLSHEHIAAKVDGSVMLQSLAAASDKLTADFGTWRTAWGEINRFQRLTGDIVHPFSDAQPSIPVGFTSGNWGSLASFGARPFRGSKKWYGTSGNSFVAVVEFGPRVRAKAVTAGGESGHPTSKHFNDQAGRYATGNLRDVYFYPSQLKGHTERVYRPGQ